MCAMGDEFEIRVSILNKFETYRQQLESMASQNCQLLLELEEETGLTLDIEVEPAQVDGYPETSRKPSDEQTNFLNTSVYTHIGKRTSNMDRFDVFIGETYQLYAVYDGHHSPAVSNYLKLHLLQTIVCALSVGNDFASAASLGFAQIQRQLQIIQNSTEENLGGSTAIVCMVTDQYIFTANLGDSRAIAMKSDSYVQPLSRPHSLNDPHEMDEVSKRGGLVFKCGKVYRLNGQINISRSFGDFQHKPYLSTTPQISVFNKSDFNYLIIGSDGFWDEADTLTPIKAVRSSCEAHLAKTLYNSTSSKSRDNATIICVKLIQ